MVIQLLRSIRLPEVATLRTHCVWFGLLLALLVFALPLNAQAPAHRSKPGRCADTSNMSQGEMNDCALKNLRDVELRLQKLLANLGIAPDSPEQKAWEGYRDAQIAAIYPEADRSSCGSVFSMCFASLKQTLTKSRIRDLKALTLGQGDVCNGYQPKSADSKSPRAH